MRPRHCDEPYRRQCCGDEADKKDADEQSGFAKALISFEPPPLLSKRSSATGYQPQIGAQDQPICRSRPRNENDKFCKGDHGPYLEREDQVFIGRRTFAECHRRE